jgi:hypothetical protein
MQPDCIAQSSKLSVCLWGALRAGGGAGSGGAEPPLGSPTSAGQGTPLLEISAILGKEVAWGPGGVVGGTSRRGGGSPLRSPSAQLEGGQAPGAQGRGARGDLGKVALEFPGFAWSCSG